MEVFRTIAGPPERTAEETITKIFEMAMSWGAERMEIPIEKSRVLLRPLIIDRTLESKALRIKFETHELFIQCAYEDTAIEMEKDDESLPENLPKPRGELEWSLRIPVTDSMLSWTKNKISELGIGEWCKIEGHMRESSGNIKVAKDFPITFDEKNIKKSLGSE